jgi:hypothetical protein
MRFLATTAAAVIAVVLATGATGPIAQATPDAERRAAFKATLNASKTEVISGKRLILTGMVKPARKGTRVVLQKRTGDKWLVEARLKTNARGVFRYTDKPHAAGIRKYRVVVPAAGRTHRGVSKPVTVGVYAWKSLSRMQERSADNTLNRGTVTFAGTPYYPGFVGVSGTSGSIEWNVFRKCIRLTARFGNNDDADTGSTANVSVLEDGMSGFAKSYGLAQSSIQTVDIRGAFRIAFAWTGSSGGVPTTGSYPTMAEPKVLCAM